MACNPLALVDAQSHTFNSFLPDSDVVVVMENWDFQLAPRGTNASTCEFSLHSHVLRAQSDYFRDLLPVCTTVPPAHDAVRTRLPLKCVDKTLPSSYLKCFSAMYRAHFHGDSVSSLAQITSVEEALEFLRVAAAIRFSAGVQVSLRYIQAATLNPDESRSVSEYFSMLHTYFLEGSVAVRQDYESDPYGFDVVLSCKCELVKAVFIPRSRLLLGNCRQLVRMYVMSNPRALESGLPAVATTRATFSRIMRLLDTAEKGLLRRV